MKKKPTRRKLSKRKYAIFALITVIFGCLLGLAGAEIAARIILPIRYPYFFKKPAGYYIPDDVVSYRQSKNFPQTWATDIDGKTKTLVYSNSMGMRDIQPPPPDGQHLRILCLGCSMTEGHGIQNTSQPWPRQLQKIYNSDSPTTPIVVMNGGVAGYNTFQQVIRGEQLSPEAQPDIFLMAYLGGTWGMWGRNDFGIKGQFRLQWDALWNADYLAYLQQNYSPASLHAMYYCFLWRWVAMVRSQSALKTQHFADRPYKDDFQKANEEALRMYKETSDRLGIKPILVYIPMLHDMDAQISKNETDHVATLVQDLCNQFDIPFYNATPRLIELFKQQHPGDDARAIRDWSVSSVDQHYSAEANSACAQVIKEMVPLEATP